MLTDDFLEEELIALLKAIHTEYLKIPTYHTQYALAKSYPLHVAAAIGDIAGMKQLLKSGISIEQRDDLNLTPLQVAAVSGQADSVRFLIEKGANVFAIDGYKLKLNALDLAVMESHAEVVTVLIEQGHMLDNSDVHEMAYFYNLAFGIIWARAPYDDPIILKDFNAALDTFAAIVETRDLALLEFPVTEKAKTDVTGIPASILMEIVASLVKTKESYDHILEIVNKINENDSCYQTYLEAKGLFHVLPVHGNYAIVYYKPDQTTYVSKITAEGHWGSFTTPMAYEMISTYIQDNLPNPSPIQTAFQVVQNVYEQACIYSKEAAIFSHAQEAYDHYQNGDIVLLPSGWNGHFVNVILDPTHNYFIVANCGMRFHSISSGANIYKMYNTDNLTPDLIYSILNNVEQMDLELVYKYELALDKVESLWQPDQIHGNCAWQSHEPAVETLLYLDLLNQGIQSREAKVMAHENYLQWDAYQTMAHLKDSFEGELDLSIYALKDILVENHPSLFKDKNNKYSDISINPAEYDQAKYIIEVLSRDVYKKDVNGVFSDLYKTAKPELLKLFDSAGFVLKPIDKKGEFEDLIEESTDFHRSSLIGLHEILQNDSLPAFPGFESILKQNPVFGFENTPISDW